MHGYAAARPSCTTVGRMTSPLAQSHYQVRFDVGLAGAAVVGIGADVVVWVDVLGESEPPADGTVVLASLRNRRAVAEWVLARQSDRGDRFFVAVVAAGETRDDGSPRFALEDQLAAGALIDALADLGIDYCSPEAAATSASFTGLRNATSHLIGSSGSGQQLAALGRRAEIERAVELDVSTDVVVLREFSAAE